MRGGLGEPEAVNRLISFWLFGSSEECDSFVFVPVAKVGNHVCFFRFRDGVEVGVGVFVPEAVNRFVSFFFWIS